MDSGYGVSVFGTLSHLNHQENKFVLKITLFKI